jgi:hypothetical protein
VVQEETRDDFCCCSMQTAKSLIVVNIIFCDGQTQKTALDYRAGSPLEDNMPFFRETSGHAIYSN